jgi:hypothetical protein
MVVESESCPVFDGVQDAPLVVLLVVQRNQQRAVVYHAEHCANDKLSFFSFFVFQVGNTFRGVALVYAE